MPSNDHILILKENFKKTTFDLGDGVHVPTKLGNEMLSAGNFMVKIKAGQQFVFAKAVKYDAPENSIIVPKWMVEKLKVDYGKIVKVESVNLDAITNIKFMTQKNIVDPISILEFELRNRNILACGDVIKSKIFEKTYEFIVKEIQTVSGVKSMGALFNNNVVSNINFEIEFN